MRFLIIGSGAIGTFVGAWLAEVGLDKGHEVVFIGREGGLIRRALAVRPEGLRITDCDGRLLELPTSKFRILKSIPTDLDFDYILISVKSQDTQAVGQQLKGCRINPSRSVFVSLQNGTRNVDDLRQFLPPDSRILAGMVGFGVHFDESTGVFHRGTSNPLVIEQDVAQASEKLLIDLLQTNLSCYSASPTEMKSIQYSKLLININNSVCALSNKPLRQELMIRGYRIVVAAAVLEGVRACKAANIPLTRVGGIRPTISPYVLVLPTFLYGLIARALLKLGGDVYSSMWEDLHRGKSTEIDFINGEIVSLAKKHGVPTPVNDTLITLIRQCERDNSIPSYSAEELVNLTGAAKYAPSPLVALSVLFALIALPIYLILRLVV